MDQLENAKSSNQCHFKVKTKRCRSTSADDFCTTGSVRENSAAISSKSSASLILPCLLMWHTHHNYIASTLAIYLLRNLRNVHKIDNESCMFLLLRSLILFNVYWFCNNCNILVMYKSHVICLTNSMSHSSTHLGFLAEVFI